MPKLYVTDLDGTLLRSDATLSPYSRTRLAEMLDQGLQLAIASARSIVSIQMILAGLPIRLPVIELNGAMVSDLATGHHRVIHAVPPHLMADIYALVTDSGHVPFISSVDATRDWLHYAGLHNEGTRWYVANRTEARDPRLHHTPDLRACFDQQIVAITLVDRLEPMEQMAAAVAERFGDALATNFFENGYTPGWFWLTIHDKRATKDQAVRDLLQLLDVQPRDLVAFGDHWNDLGMLQLAGTAIAMANATDELKAHATHIIGPNDDDSVAKYILHDWQP